MMTNKVKRRKELWEIKPDVLKQLKQEVKALGRKSTYSPWQWNGRDFDFNSEDLGDSVGFVYLIEFPNEQKYVGAHLYGLHTNYYIGSGVLAERYKNIYKLSKSGGIGGYGITRTILDFGNSGSELNKLEKYFIKEYGAFEKQEYLNLSRGGYGFKTENDVYRPVIAFNEWGDSITYENIFQASVKISEFTNEPDFCFTNNTIRAYVTGENTRYELYLRDIHYADATPQELEELEKARHEIRMDRKREVIGVVIEREIKNPESGKLENVIEKRVWSTAGIVLKKLNMLFNLNLKDSKSILESARGETLGYRDWEGVIDIYMMDFEINGTMHVLEERRKQLEQDKIDDAAKRSNVMSKKQFQPSTWKLTNRKNPVTVWGSEGVSKLLNVSRPAAKSILAGRSNVWKKEEYKVEWFTYKGNTFVNDGHKTKTSPGKAIPWTVNHFDDTPSISLESVPKAAEHFNITRSKAQGWRDGTSNTWKDPKHNIASLEFGDGTILINDGIWGTTKTSIFYFTDGRDPVSLRGKDEIAKYFNVSKDTARCWVCGNCRSWRRPEYGVAYIVHDGKIVK